VWPARGKVPFVVHYRSFRNNDPPSLALIWNEAFTARGEVRLKHSSPLESYVFAKPYFDPAGLIVALDDGVPIGFAHAGFGPTSAQAALDSGAGVISLIGVRPSYRRQGIGTELLRRCEEYLTSRGATVLFAGPMAPYNPFYFGLYGGSDSPGFLASDVPADAFLRRHGYQVEQTCLIFQRGLSQAVNIVDGRFAALRKNYEVRIVPRTGTGTWWQESTLGPVEVVEFHLQDKTTTQVVAHTSVWEMDLFSWRWSQPAVGILEVSVLPELRRQGLAKFLMIQLLRYLQEQYFGLTEVQLLDHNQPALGFFRGLGFDQVDVGRLYKK
jgi:ribosomal protein S18 acetylase RimI-like enzyme